MATRNGFENKNRRVIRDLSARNKARVAEAQLEIRTMPPDEAVRLLSTIFERDRIQRRRLPWFLLCIGAGYLVFYLVQDQLGYHVSAGSVIQNLVIGLAIGIGASSRLRRNSSDVLVQFDDPRLIDSLITCLKSGTVGHARPLRALTALLPTISPSQSHLVSAESRAFLNHALLHNTNKEFVLAILAAWQQIADRDAVPVVEQLAGAGGFVEKDASIREAAIAALPAIRESANRVTVSETLLRAAGTGDSEALLRAAAATNTAEELLLRPSSEQHPQ